MSLGAGIGVAGIWLAIAAMSFSGLSGFGMAIIVIFGVMATAAIAALPNS